MVKAGDTVRVSFEGKVTRVGHGGEQEGWLLVESDYWVGPGMYKEVQAPLPTKFGSVIDAGGVRWVWDGEWWTEDSEDRDGGRRPGHFDGKAFTVVRDGV